MDQTLKYIQNQLTISPDRLKSYIENEQGREYPKRYIYSQIDQYISNFLAKGSIPERWVIIPGLRGVGKTTVIAQVFMNYYKQVDERRILYISLDEVINVLDISLRDILSGYEQILGESFEKLSKPVFIFIDEVQYDPKWALILKSIYDRSKKVFIICSGSSAVSLQTNSDVARRSISEKLFPTSFTEFLLIRDNRPIDNDLKKKVEQALFYSTSAQETYDRLKSLETPVIQSWSNIDRQYINEYLRIGTLPFAIQIRNEARVYKMINSLLDKVINQDIQVLGRFEPKTINNIKRLLLLLAESDIVSVQKIAKILETSVVTVTSILEVMEQSELLIRIMPHGSNSKKVRKPSRYQFMSAAMRSAFLSVAGNEQILSTQKGKLMEDIVAMTLYKEFSSTGRGSLSYDNSKAGSDFILTIASQNIIPIEVGIGDKMDTQVRNTMKKVSSKYGLVISNSPLALADDKSIVKVPLDYFLLV